MKQFLTIISILLSFFASGQTDTVFIRRNTNCNNSENAIYRQDTFVFQSPYYRQILVGTSVVNSLQNYRAMNIHGFDFYKVESSGCNADYDSFNFMKNKILCVDRTDSLLIAEIIISANCGYSFLCEIEIINDSTLNLIANGYGNYFSCDCYYNLKYYIKLKEDYDTDRIEYFMINDDEETILQKKN